MPEVLFLYFLTPKQKGLFMKLLILGDVVGNAGLTHLEKHLRKQAAALGADFVWVNGENATEIHGLNAFDAQRLLDAGADLITLGNHAFSMRDLEYFLDDHPSQILRPANYPPSAPGFGWVILPIGGLRLLAINLAGTVFMESLDNPFVVLSKILTEQANHFDEVVVDLHAEATSEKWALARAFDGKISCLFGTHTHVPTADACILPGGTGYVTDLGMTGPTGGILGTDSTAVLRKLRDHLPAKFTVASGPVRADGILVSLQGGKAVEIRRISF